MAWHVAVGQDILWFQTGFPWQFSPCWIHKEHPCGSKDETSPSPPVLLKQVFGLVFSRVLVSCGSDNSLLTDLASKHRNESTHNSGGRKFKVRIAGLESGCRDVTGLCSSGGSGETPSLAASGFSAASIPSIVATSLRSLPPVSHSHLLLSLQLPPTLLLQVKY